eukprot:m.131936 g.131936  ORF g.131936 m.131936 type:complete len:503 (+) comp38056_c0_seq3:43-1551(+)
MASGFITRSDSASQQNRMELVSRGSIDSFTSAGRSTSQSSFRNTFSRQSQVSLEYLPPEDVDQSKARAERLTSPADSEWDRILNSFEYHRQKEVGENGGDESVPSFQQKRYGADALWIMQAERDESSGESEDSGEYVEDLDAEEESQPSVKINEGASVLKKALAKIEKLDKILAERVKKEKELKQQRLDIEKQIQLLEDQQLREHLERQKSYGRSKKETAKLAMQKNEREEERPLPLQRQELVEIAESDCSTTETPVPSGTVTPLFATQPGNLASGRQSVTTDKDSEQAEDKRKELDFIKRNIALAADAGSTVAMTAEEKKRLDELLFDIGAPDEAQVETSNTAVQVLTGEGYVPCEGDLKALESLNLQLNAFVPDGDWEERASVMAGGSSALTKEDHDGIEEIILPEKETDANARLREIDRTLEELKAEADEEASCLDTDQLQSLIAQCVKEQKKLGIYKVNSNSNGDTGNEMETSDNADSSEGNSNELLADSQCRFVYFY